MRIFLLFLPCVALVAACAPVKKVKYNPDDFINPNRVVTKIQQPKLPQTKIAATFGLGNDPAVVKAYQQFLRKGVAPDVQGNGFRTLAYSATSHPIVACEPLHLCVVQLENNESINNIDIGDSAHWLVTTSRIGTSTNGSMQVVLKPKAYDVATDLIITTNKRTYNIGLVSTQGQATHVVNFYYPEETLQRSVQAAVQTQQAKSETPVVATTSDIDLNHVNFNYALRGENPAWRPVRVFDDSVKTFIQMPSVSDRLDLPVLYLKKGNDYTLVNYRYQQPYYIVDGLFQTAFLVSGKGRDQVRVEIDNKNFS